MPTKAREQVGGAHRTPMKVPLTKRQLMKPILVFFTLVAIVASQNAFCQEKKPPVSSKVQDSEKDWDAAYEELLRNDDGVREKVKNGQATKADVIAWMKGQTQAGEKKSPDANSELATFRKKLGELVKARKLTRAEAADLWETMAGSDKKMADNGTDWEAAYERLIKKDPSVQEKVDSGDVTKEEVIAWMKLNLKAEGKKNGSGKTGARPGSVNFYSIVIGRLRSKDIELGEMEIDIDYVISDRAQLNADLIGKRVKLVGVAGQFLDSLLQIKRGETLKVRTGDFNPETKQLGFGYKFQVLERTAPFKPENFGVPPKEFRGFAGELTGKVVETAGYEVLLQVSQVQPADENKAADPNSIKGRRIRIAGFYNDHADAFADLHDGDLMRVSTRHRNPQSDSLDVTETLEKVEK